MTGPQDSRKSLRKITSAVSKAWRYAWSQVIARHGQLPPVQVADRQLAGITCIRLDATVVAAYSDKEQTEPNFKGFGLFLSWPNATTCVSRCPGGCGGSPDSHTAEDYLQLLDEVIAALPPEVRRKLMVTCDDAAASHDLV